MEKVLHRPHPPPSPLTELSSFLASWKLQKPREKHTGGWPQLQAAEFASLQSDWGSLGIRGEAGFPQRGFWYLGWMRRTCRGTEAAWHSREKCLKKTPQCL